MDELRLTLLGRPQVVLDDMPLTGWGLRKSLALLAYLAVTGRPHSRGALAGLLWWDCNETNARSGLRKVLAELRRRVPSHLTITRTEVAFNRASNYWLDEEVFERDIGQVLALCRSPVTPADAAALAEAMELYRGDFLVGLDLHRAPGFEEWVLLEREHLRNLGLRALHALVDHYAARSQPERTLAYIDRLLALEPAHEEAHRHKMLLLARSGQRAAALRQYEACRRALQALHADPDGETTALHERICAGLELRAPSTAPGRSLLAPLTPLFGRDAEVAEIRARLHDPSCRLLTLAGPGGVGKTHLVLKVVDSMLPPNNFQDGVYVVRLGSVPAVEAIVPAIAQAVDLPLSEGAPPQQQVADYLWGKQLLLVLDGFEHLLAGAGLLVDLLHAVPSLKILVTSQVRLDVEGETLLPIPGLACPDRLPEDSETLASSPAVQLFVSSAQRIQPGLMLTDAELSEVARLCRLVGGLPLAILLAASWAGMLSPAEIAGADGPVTAPTGGREAVHDPRTAAAVRRRKTRRSARYCPTCPRPAQRLFRCRRGVVVGGFAGTQAPVGAGRDGRREREPARGLGLVSGAQAGRAIGPDDRWIVLFLQVAGEVRGGREPLQTGRERTR